MAPYHEAGAAGWSPPWLAGFGVLCLLFFWVPYLAPVIQMLTLVQSIRAARWGVAEPWSLTVGVGGALLGFALFLARSRLGIT